MKVGVRKINRKHDEVGRGLKKIPVASSMPPRKS
jgi:hypothetical protein